MNKFFTALLVAASATGVANAQAVLGYQPSAKTGTYLTLQNPTTVFSVAADAEEIPDITRTIFSTDGIINDEGTTKGFNLGFSLKIGDTPQTSFAITGVGTVYFGTETVRVEPNAGANYLSYGSDVYVTGAASFRGTGATKNTVISYGAASTDGFDGMVIQYENLAINYDFWNDGIETSFQIQLDKSGKISVVFKDLSAFGDNKPMFRIGVRGGDDFICATGTPSALSLSRNTTDNVTFSSSDAAGTAIVFAPPTVCETPAASPKDLELTSTSTDIKGSFTPSGSADTYLVLYTTGEASFPTPENGKTYAPGDMIDDGVIVSSGPSTSFSCNKLEGGTQYNFAVYAANSYGLEGPVYRVNDALTGGVKTAPGAPEEVAFTDASAESITMNVKGNNKNDDVVVLITPYCQRSMYGDHGLFGPLSADTKTGDVLEIPEDFTQDYPIEGAPEPENGGIVAYVGAPADGLVISGLAPSTMYYVTVYSRNAEGEYSSTNIQTGWSTVIEGGYEGDSFNFPRFTIPFAWTTSEADRDAHTFSFTDEVFFNRTDNTVSQGTQLMQMRARLTAGDATNGMTATLTPQVINVDGRHLMARFNYNMTAAASRFSTEPYNSWDERDELSILVSADNGETWESLASYTSVNNPQLEELTSYTSIQADLNAYRGQSVLVRLQWTTFSVAPFGTIMTVDRFSLLPGEFPEVPEVTVGGITSDKAVASWTSSQTDYELTYNVKGADLFYTTIVKGASSYTMENLVPETEYEVKVRGILEDGSGYSEWSDPVEFTTLGYPEVDAPENLESDTETFAALGYVQLSWSTTADMVSYEVNYRKSSDTEWKVATSTIPTLLLTDLEPNERYIWKVKAFCTHDRETAFSAQASFTSPDLSGVDAVTAGEVSVSATAGEILVKGAEGLRLAVYSLDGTAVASVDRASAAESFNVANGVYIVIAGNSTYRIIVK